MNGLVAGMPDDILMALLGAALLLGVVIGLLLIPIATQVLRRLVSAVRFNRHFRIVKKRSRS